MMPLPQLRVDANITDAIDRWIELGMPPGSCTEFLLRGDYERALRSAHPMIKPHWDDHVTYVKTCVPACCRGENYDTWQGIEYHRKTFNQTTEELFTI
jgi:hypothetical protein